MATQTVTVKALHLVFEDILHNVGDTWETTPERAAALGDTVEIIAS